MFCPRCALEVTESLKFCKQCGANLTGVRDAMMRGASGTSGETPAFDWSKTWVAEMLMSEEERDRVKGINPEIKRYNEIKAGVITTCVGIGVSIFLNILMSGIAAQNPNDAEILLRIWVAGIIPIMVGLALIINGMFISRKMNKALGAGPERVSTNPLGNPVGNPQGGRLRAGNEPPALEEPRMPAQPDFSVAEPSTQRMPDSNQN